MNIPLTLKFRDLSLHLSFPRTRESRLVISKNLDSRVRGNDGENLKSKRAWYITKLTSSFVFLTGLTVNSLAFAAEVPVVDAYQDTQAATTSAPTTTTAAPVTLSVDQRVTVLERQIASIKQLSTQISDLQQQLQELRGLLDTQQHDLKVVQDQMRTQYQDLDQRLTTAATKQSTSNTESASTSAADSAATDTQEETAYQAAFNLLKKKKYPQATTAFKKFIQQYPTGTNSANANYWLGQLYLLQGQPDKAIKQFSLIVKKYPTNAKVPEAQLQLGLAYYAQGDLKQAKAQFTKVKQKYPGTAVAKSAQTRLQQLQQTMASPSADASTDSTD